MDRRVHLVVLFAAVVALAGCSGGTPGQSTTVAGTAGGTGSGTATAASGSEAALQTSDQAIQSFSYPDGASPDGITDLDTLLNEHASALSGDSFTLNGTTTFSLNSGGQGDSAPITYRIAFDAADNEALTTVGGLTAGTLTSYSDGTTKYYRIQNDSGTSYGTAEPGERLAEGTPQTATGEGLFRAMLQRGNFTATGVFTENGTEFVQYNLTSVTTDRDIDVGERTYDGYLIVDSSGIIHEADVSMRSEGSSLTFTYDAHLEITNVGNTTVEEPSWVSNAG